MYLKNNLLTIFLVITLMSNSAFCLKCQVCNSAEPGQEDCFTVEPKDTKYLMNCEGPMNVTCRTQEQWVDFEVLKQVPDKRVIRQCASTEFDPSRACYYRTGFGGKTSVCNCLGDGCNSAGRTASALLMTIGALLLLKMFH
uniref:Protein sleepless n=1 Tax=Parasteatoda tepidariorum TaxID=114398 RepID=A0A2L2XXV9_PARTP